MAVSLAVAVVALWFCARDVGMGVLLFSADASHVVKNPAFQAKLLLLAAALINVVIAHAGSWRHVERWGDEAPAAAKATALASLVLWLGVHLRRPPDRILLNGGPPCAACASPSSQLLHRLLRHGRGRQRR